jgi:hypothetical protein
MLMLGVIVGFVLSNIVVLILRYASQVKARPEEHTKILNFTRTLRSGRKAKLIPVRPQSTATITSHEHLQPTEKSVGI